MGFVAKVFHRLIVQKTIDCLAVRFCISLIHHAAGFYTPFGDDKRISDVKANSDKSYCSEMEIE